MIYFAVFCFAAICFTSIGTQSLDSFSRHKLDDFCRRNEAERKLAQILKGYERAVAVAGMLRLILSVIFVTVAVHWFYPSVSIQESRMRYVDWTLFTAVLSLLLLFGFCFARAMTHLYGTYFVYYTWQFWQMLSVLLYPLSLADRFFDVFFCRLAGKTDDDDAFEEEIRTIVTEGHREGLLEEEAREMIEGVMELGDFTVSEIMTPRTDMVCISQELSWDEMLNEVITSSHSRIPVYGENRDDIIGVLYSKDLLRELIQYPEQERHPWTSLIKEPLFVPETKPVDTLLREFQNVQLASDSGSNVSPVKGGADSPRYKNKGHLAIVLDEYGGVSGIVTLEDILEEIVGEILDEHDSVIQTQDIQETAPDVFEVLGKVRIDDLNEKLHLVLPEEEDYDTIAGFIFSTLGYIPSAGEQVEYKMEDNQAVFTVVEATRRRIEKITIRLTKG